MRNVLLRQRGMSSLQAVLIVGTAFLILFSLSQVWTEAQAEFNENVAVALRGEGMPQGRGGQGSNTGSSSGTESGTDNSIGKNPQPGVLPDGVVRDPDTGAVLTSSDTERERDASGELNSASDAERARNLAAIKAALATSEHGIVLIAGDHDGGMSFAGPDSDQFDHVMVAVSNPDGSVSIFELNPDPALGGSRNFGSANPPPRSLDQVAGSYDVVGAVPVNNITDRQASDLIASLATRTAPGQTYSIVEFDIPGTEAGEICTSSVAKAFIDAGILPPDFSTSDGGFHNLRPGSLLDTIRDLNRTTR